MTTDNVKSIYKLLTANKIRVWIDGGWGVDALLKGQTRHHQDLDIAIDISDFPKVKDLLVGLGYQIYQDEFPTRVELRDSDDHRIDIHPLTFDEHGNGLQQLQDGGFGTYSTQGLLGEGLIGGQKVDCLSAQLQMRFHLGYEPTEDDIHDVLALHKRFNLELEGAYKNRH